jgi:WS/DGAT/MGAT family acyltransferase
MYHALTAEPPMTRISITDYAFLLTETADSPRHVGALQVFRPPQDYPGDFIGDLMAELRARRVHRPFDQRLRVSVTGVPSWAPDPTFDIDYHLRRSALPAPGSRAQLDDLASRLHSFLLDRDHPLWEIHFVEGLEDGCFAVYTKIHHAYTDGATLTRMANGSLSADPNDRAVHAFWEMGKGEPVARADRDLRRALGGLGGGLKSALVMAKELGGVAGSMALDRLGLAHSRLDVPFTAPRTAFNGPLGRARRIAGVSLEMDRLKAVAKRTGTTLNDVVVTICDLALRRYLARYAELPKEPLVAQLPVNLRRDGEGGITNILGIIPVRLAGDSRSPLKRLREVHRSCAEMKEAVSELSRNTVMAYTLLIQGVAVVGDLLGASSLLPPHGNILISNLPGSPVPLYLRGARLEEIYPISTIPPHMVLNITAFSYDGRMFFGMIGGYDAVPRLAELTDFLRDALQELEAEAVRALAGEGDRPASPRKPVAGGKRPPRKASATAHARSGGVKAP